MSRSWIHAPSILEACEKFIKNNPKLKLSKAVHRKNAFVFYREYTNFVTKEKQELPEFRIILTEDRQKNVGWSVSYKRHTGKWWDMPIFGGFGHCLKEIKSGKWYVLDPME